MTFTTIVREELKLYMVFEMHFNIHKLRKILDTGGTMQTVLTNYYHTNEKTPKIEQNSRADFGIYYDICNESD